MVEAILWIAGIGVLVFFLLIPMAVHLLKKALVEPEPAVERQLQTETRESQPQEGRAGI